MKRIFLTFVAVIAVCASMVGCKAFTQLSSGESTTGKPYEMVLICGQHEWQSELGDTLRSVFKQPVAEIVQYEPMFDVIRIMPNNFKSLTKRHRNIVSIIVDASISESEINVDYDVTAAPQVFVTVKAHDNATAAQYVSENRENLLYILEKAERDRTINYARHYYSKGLNELILQNFGVDMFIPETFKLRTESDDMVWISQEYPTASKGFFLYKYPYTGTQSLTASELIKARNRFAQRIPGPADGSYMTTVKEIADETGQEYVPFAPEYKTIRIGERPWIEMVGLWEVENYFMGGPYVSYTTVNQVTKEVITIDCYVYSPQKEKRNMLRELQHMVYLMDIPTPSAAE